MIPLFDISRQNKILKIELEKTISSVMANGIFILGKRVAEFEKEFAKYTGVKYAVGVASGTDAISLALLAVGIGRGDEVIMPANAYPSVFAVTAIGAIPKLVDIDASTYNMDPDKIEAAMTKKTRAILPVHLYGQPADMGKILTIGKKHNIPVIEDCAQAVGSEVSILGSHPLKLPKSLRSLKDKKRRGIWKRVGSMGDAGCFSFYPTKNLGAFGDGGMVVTDNPEIYEKVKLLRMYGEKSRYNSILAGRNSRLDELQAAILLVKIKYLDGWIERRIEIANLYKKSLSNLKGIALPLQGDALKKHVCHLFVIRTKRRDELKKYLEEKGIGTAIHYPVPIHLVPSMKYLGYKKGDFPQSEKACREILSLPMFPELRDEEVKLVVKTINSFQY